MSQMKAATFGSAVLLYFAISSVSGSALLLPQTPSSQQQPSPSPTMMTFRIIAKGQLLDEDGHQLASTAYKATDGSKLTGIYREFETEGLSVAYFEKQTAKALKVIKSEPKTNRAGSVVGVRAEVTFSAGGKATSAILWTNGPQFYEIVSDSVTANLALEKTLLP